MKYLLFVDGEPFKLMDIDCPPKIGSMITVDGADYTVKTEPTVFPDKGFTIPWIGLKS